MISSLQQDLTVIFKTSRRLHGPSITSVFFLPKKSSSDIVNTWKRERERARTQSGGRKKKMMQLLGFRGGSAASSPSSSTGKEMEPSPRSDPRGPSSSVAVASPEPGRPLRLVYCDDKGKFRMDPEAVAALHLVKGPIGVVSVCGRARQGKSFILNQVLPLPLL